MPEAPDLIGTTLDGRYRLVRKHSEGGMGRVYEGVQVSFDRRVAVKTLHPRLAYESRFRERFLLEAKSASKIDHPNVVHIMDFGNTPDGSVYFVMEYLEGQDLRALLKKEGRLSWSRARGILVQAVDGLVAAHERNIVHRDIKPGNCFLVDPGSKGGPELVKLLDFGIAKVGSDVDESQLTGTGEVYGTAAYMAPEQARGEPLDARSDVYSLGVMAYEMLTGQVPFRGATAVHVITRHLTDTPKRPRERVPSIPAAVEALILMAMAKDVGDRFASMVELREAIERIPADAGDSTGEAFGIRRTAQLDSIPDSMLEAATTGPTTALESASQRAVRPGSGSQRVGGPASGPHGSGAAGVGASASDGHGETSLASGPQGAEAYGSGPHGAEGQGSGPHGAEAHGSGPHGGEGHGSGPHGTQAHGSGPHGTQAHGSGPHGTQAHGSGPYGAQVHGSGPHGSGPRGTPSAPWPAAAPGAPMETIRDRWGSDASAPTGPNGHVTWSQTNMAGHASTGPQLAQGLGPQGTAVTDSHPIGAPSMGVGRKLALIVAVLLVVGTVSTIATLALLGDEDEPPGQEVALAGAASQQPASDAEPREAPPAVVGEAVAEDAAVMDDEPAAVELATEDEAPPDEAETDGVAEVDGTSEGSEAPTEGVPAADDTPTDPDPEPAEPEPEVDEPKTVKAPKPHRSAECADRRARADAAQSARKWREVLSTTSVSSCWSPGQQSRRRGLRVMAHLQLREFGKCVRAGRGLKDANIKKAVSICEKQQGKG